MQRAHYVRKRDRMALRRSIARGIIAEMNEYLFPTTHGYPDDEWADDRKCWIGPEVLQECMRALEIMRRALKREA